MIDYSVQLLAMKDTRKTIIVNEAVFRVFQRLQDEHNGVSSSWLLLHLAVEHDAAEDLRATLKSRDKGDRQRPLLGWQPEPGWLPDVDAEAEGMTKEEWARKHGTPKENAKLLDVLGIPADGAVMPYVPLRYGPGRPKGAKDSKPRKKRVKNND